MSARIETVLVFFSDLTGQGLFTKRDGGAFYVTPPRQWLEEADRELGHCSALLDWLDRRGFVQRFEQFQDGDTFRAAVQCEFPGKELAFRHARTDAIGYNLVVVSTPAPAPPMVSGTCSLCGQSAGPGARTYPAAEFGWLLRAGLSPPPRARANLASFYRSPVRAETEWVRAFHREPGDGTVCAACAPLADECQSHAAEMGSSLLVRTQRFSALVRQNRNTEAGLCIRWVILDYLTPDKTFDAGRFADELALEGVSDDGVARLLAWLVGMADTCGMCFSPKRQVIVASDLSCALLIGEQFVPIQPDIDIMTRAFGFKPPIRVVACHSLLPFAGRDHLTLARSAAAELSPPVALDPAATAVKCVSVYSLKSELAEADRTAFAERVLADQARRGEDARSAAAVEAARQAAKRRAEEEEQGRRKAQRLCVMCGKSLDFIGLMLGRQQHPNCITYQE